MSKLFGFILLLTIVPLAASQSVAAKTQDLKEFLKHYASEGGQPGDTRYIAAPIRFNQRRQGFIVYVEGRGWCGSGGCEMLVLAQKGLTYDVIAETTITRLPIRQLISTHNQMPDLGVTVCGGGIMRCYEAVLRFNGKKYPENPSMIRPEKTISKGTVLISDKSTVLDLFSDAEGR